MGSEFEPQPIVAKDEFGSGDFGCRHYRRRCKIRAPCCNEIFDCRHCHNEAKNSLEIDPLLRHDLPRHEVHRVICSLCGTEQDVQRNCQNCGVCMGKYFCQKCIFFEDDVSKKQYHCDECGICRTGGKENSFHCNKCGCCYSKLIKDSHHCIEKAMHQNCPVCFEFLFDTMKGITVLPCGHTIHLDCVEEMERHSRLLRLQCRRCTGTKWCGFCNDCGMISEVHFHILAHKCLRCKSYNTRQIKGGPASSSCSSSGNRIVEMVR